MCLPGCKLPRAVSDSTTTLKWYNAAYNSGTKVLRMDSFSYHPTQPLDTVLKYTPYQTDYITFRSGALQLTDFNLEKYKKDSSILAQHFDRNPTGDYHLP
jgi:hypothetical protein